MSRRLTASDRARRILAIVPWIAAHDGPTEEEVCERFAISRADLLADLDVVFMVGTPPYTPDTLIEVESHDGRVWVRLGDYFRRPLRLTPSEVLPLLAAGRAQLAAAGSEPDGALARATAKLAASLGEFGELLEVRLGTGAEGTLGELRQAIEERRSVDLRYYSYGRDAHSTRTVDPHHLEARDGAWYVTGFCHQAGAERVFRVDRIESLHRREDHFDPPDEAAPSPGFQPGPDAPRVTLALRPGARWVLDYYPAEESTVADDGSATVTLAVAELPWLARLLLRLGPEAAVIDVSAPSAETAREVRQLRGQAAARVLARYRDRADATRG